METARNYDEQTEIASNIQSRNNEMRHLTIQVTIYLFPFLDGGRKVVESNKRNPAEH
jgi:hypothetical protein